MRCTKRGRGQEAVFIGHHAPAGGRAGLHHFAGAQQEIRARGLAHGLVAGGEGLVDQNAAGRHAGQQRGQQRPPQVVGDDHGAEAAAGQGPRAVLDVRPSRCRCPRRPGRQAPRRRGPRPSRQSPGPASQRRWRPEPQATSSTLAPGAISAAQRHTQGEGGAFWWVDKEAEVTSIIIAGCARRIWAGGHFLSEDRLRTPDGAGGSDLALGCEWTQSCAPRARIKGYVHLRESTRRGRRQEQLRRRLDPRAQGPGARQAAAGHVHAHRQPAAHHPGG